MAPTSSADRYLLTRDQGEYLLDIAQLSIEKALSGERARVDVAACPGALSEDGASFVTLNRNACLRGCIGSLQAYQPLVLDVADNAYNAAFRDRRFTPLVPAELPGLEIHISVLTPPEPMTFSSEATLLEQLQPDVDGLVLSAGPRRGTFLPSVWESLPDARDFLEQLKLKAGLPRDYWSEDLLVERYRTSSVIRHIRKKS